MRYSTFPLTPAVRPKSAPCCREVRKEPANISTFTMSMPVVAGALPPKNPETPRPAAAREKFTLVPQAGQRVALMPTRLPQAGHILGRGASLLPNIPRSPLFILSTRNRHSLGSAILLLATRKPRSYNTGVAAISLDWSGWERDFLVSRVAAGGLTLQCLSRQRGFTFMDKFEEF